MAKQLSMAATARVIWLYACVRYWPYFGTVEPAVCFYLLNLALFSPYNLAAQHKVHYYVWLKENIVYRKKNEKSVKRQKCLVLSGFVTTTNCFSLLMKSQPIHIFLTLKLFAFYPIWIRFLHVVTNLCGRKVRNGAGPIIRYPIPKLVKPKIRKPRYRF